MNESRCFSQNRKRRVVLAATAGFTRVLHLAFPSLWRGQIQFLRRVGAAQAAPKSHRVIFENALIRVLGVSASSGTTVPMHPHRWPSLLVSWDTGGRSPHVCYHSADGTVKDIPSTDVPIHPGTWAVEWMKPEPMHSVEILDAPAANTDLRIEIKCLP
jgi:hypothetical protein